MLPQQTPGTNSLLPILYHQCCLHVWRLDDVPPAPVGLILSLQAFRYSGGKVLGAFHLATGECACLRLSSQLGLLLKNLNRALEAVLPPGSVSTEKLPGRHGSSSSEAG